MVIDISEAPRSTREAQQDWKRLASIIDHTLLKPQTSSADVERVCREASEFGFACVLVNGSNVALAASLLSGTAVKVGSVAGFPLGATTTNVKRHEIIEVTRLGAREVDMVINIGALNSGDRARVQADIRGCVQIAHDAGALLKVTIEAGLLTLEEKILACQLAAAAGADYLKSSTGFTAVGAVPADIALMRGVAGDKLGVKAAGGIRSLRDVQAMIDAGADRIGTSASVAIIEEARALS